MQLLTYNKTQLNSKMNTKLIFKTNFFDWTFSSGDFRDLLSKLLNKFLFECYMLRVLKTILKIFLKLVAFKLFTAVQLNKNIHKIFHRSV